MSQLVVEPPSERVAHPHKTIENVPGRLGPRPVNRVVAATGLPWQRRLARAALFIPAIRHWERHYLKLNDDDLKDFVALQAKFKDSENSWTVDAKGIDTTTYDLSVKNPNKADETELRAPQDIIAEMAALDAESAKILNSIEAML